MDSNIRGSRKHSQLLEFFASFYAIVSQINPFLYLIMYISSIPFFAAIYDSLPGGFYAPYARMERYGLNDAYNAGHTFEAAIRRAVSQADNRSEAPAIRADSITVQRLRALDGEQINFDVTALINDQRLRGLAQLSFSVTTTNTSVLLVWPGGQKASINFQCFTSKEPLVPNEVVNQVEQSVFGKLFPGVNGNFNSCLPLTEPENAEIRKFFNGISGDATAVSGDFWRMLYFSAIVITTVGFGDIVPMTGLTRTLVALEALWGIITLGLFLNALAFRASKGSTSGTSV